LNRRTGPILCPGLSLANRRRGFGIIRLLVMGLLHMQLLRVCFISLRQLPELADVF
jgi:hypothetical protein